MTANGKGGVCRTTDLVQQSPHGAERAARAQKRRRKNFIVVCLADWPSYLNSLLHATTLVRPTPPQHDCFTQLGFHGILEDNTTKSIQPSIWEATVRSYRYVVNDGQMVGLEYNFVRRMNPEALTCVPFAANKR